jgi:ubiquinone/menaquinone biosynthesis C-methylase UbiE
LGLISIFLKAFFRLLYHEFAWTYDFVAAFVSGGRWLEWTGSAASFVQGPDILELGFGPGHLLVKLKNSENRVVGLDASRQMVRVARKRLAGKYIMPSLVLGTGQSLPFASASFNSIVSTFPTAYIFQEATLAEIRRLLRPDRCAVILLSAWITDRSFVSRFLAWLFRVTGQVPPVNFNEQHLLAPFIEAHFNARTHWLDLPSSRLLYVIAQKDV